jgi:hypothetical protein
MAISNIVDIDDMEGRYATSTNTYSKEKFDSFVTQEQYDLLIDILGAGLYNTYSADNANADWLALLNGETYTDCAGYVQNWQGLKYLMKPFIQSRWVESDHLKALQSGLAKSEVENATIATEYERKDYAYRRWNQFIDRYKECELFLYTKNSNDSDKYTDFWIHFRPKYKNGIAVKTNIT